MSYSARPRRVHTVEMRVQLQAVASTLRAARGYRGYTIKQVAELTGLNESTIGYVERFRQVPSLDVLLTLSELYGLEFDLRWPGDERGQAA